MCDLTRNYLNGTIPPLMGFPATSNQNFGSVGTNLLERYPISSENGQISSNYIQASGLDGPIPQEIAYLTKMTDLRISDLNGMEATFPHLNNMTNMSRLIMRIDLSFNKLNGEIPSNFVNLSTVEFVDLSYNNFRTCLQALQMVIHHKFPNLLELCPACKAFDAHKGQRELKNFNIEKAAGGVNKETIQTFTAVVTNSTLEIRLYWADQGTTGIPRRGVYGPLISTISVFNPDYVSKNKNNISVGALVGIVAIVVFVIILLLGILWWRGCLLRKETMEHDLKGLDLQTGSFTLRQLKAATNNFDVANKIGEGGFGSVYKLSSKSKQGNREFVNEIGMISALQHPYLVKLYGCCVEGNQLLLVYEYMENNSLARALFEECQLKLDWATRYKICIGIARGLAYLHEESRLKIVHRDIKATNVLLDNNLNPKISDFGLAKLGEENDTHISTRIAGTYGYMAPEYAIRGYLTDKADVYSFGIVAFEIVSGRHNTSCRRKEDSFYLLDWALELKEKGKLMELVDPKLGPDFIEKEVIVMINVALLCTNVTPTVRPTMSSVVNMLEGKTVIKELVSNSTVFSHKITLKGMMANLQHSYETYTHDSLTEMPLIASSSSAADLYPLHLNSDYWANRE
ncbi:unnamed protein product [Camellia sinensis]